MDKLKVLKRILDWSRRKSNGCLVCYLGLRNDGYSNITIDKKVYKTSRIIMYLIKDFDLSSELLILHDDLKCNSRACIEIDHLRIGTHKENTGKIAENPHMIYFSSNHGNAAIMKRKEFCIKGHKLDGRNNNGKRYCKTCARERYYLRVKNV